MTSISHGSLLLIFFLGITQAYLLFELVKIFIVICHLDKHSIEIEFPLKNGKYLITDGGNSKISRLMNYHYYSPVHKKNRTNNSMKFATDVVKTGVSKKLFLPPKNTDYMIFSEKVYSPFSGTIIKVESSINDNIPYSGNYPYNTGNTVIIKNNDLYFLIGHLKKGSIIVKPGDSVKENDLLAECGNSGYSERPHIHMQLIHCTNDDYWKGSGASISFKSKPLYKNRLIRSLHTA
jgi:biotin carboxyl carrier protein